MLVRLHMLTLKLLLLRILFALISLVGSCSTNIFCVVYSIEIWQLAKLVSGKRTMQRSSIIAVKTLWGTHTCLVTALRKVVRIMTRLELAATSTGIKRMRRKMRRLWIVSSMVLVGDCLELIWVKTTRKARERVVLWNLLGVVLSPLRKQ